jgi:hypothetical protein
VQHDPTAVVYRFYGNGHHFLTLSEQEGINAHFSLEGIAFHVLTEQLPGTIPLYRCYAASISDHFVSPDANCENTGRTGYRNEGLYGYVYQQQEPGTSELFRCFGGHSDHLSTTNPAECTAARYTVEGSQGWVPNN